MARIIVFGFISFVLAAASSGVAHAQPGTAYDRDISDAEIEAALDGWGDWHEDVEHGSVWRPRYRGGRLVAAIADFAWSFGRYHRSRRVFHRVPHRPPRTVRWVTHPRPRWHRAPPRRAERRMRRETRPTRRVEPSRDRKPRVRPPRRRQMRKR